MKQENTLPTQQMLLLIREPVWKLKKGSWSLSQIHEFGKRLERSIFDFFKEFEKTNKTGQ